MPSLYPQEWVVFCAENFDKEKCKTFINSDNTQTNGGLAGRATAYMTSLKEYAEGKEYLATWWGTACGEQGAHTLASAAVKEARMVLIGAKAATLVHFKAQKLDDKKLKRNGVNKIKEMITSHNVSDIFPAAFSKLLIGV